MNTSAPLTGKPGLSKADFAAMSDDVAGVDMFLAWGACASMRGVEVPVDGGWSTL